MPPWVWMSASSEGYLICSPSPSSSCRCPLSQTREWSLGSLHQPEKHWLFRGPYADIFKPLVISVAICWTFSSGSVSFESLRLRTRFMSQWQPHYCHARGNTISHLLNFDPHFTLCHWSVCWQLAVVWFPPFPWDHLGPLSSNTWFQALCHLGSGSIILNLFLAILKHLLNPVTKQSGWKMNLLITVIIYHPNKCHGTGYCYQQYLILNSILSRSKHNLWWKLLETLPIHGRSSWE